MTGIVSKSPSIVDRSLSAHGHGSATSSEQGQTNPPISSEAGPTVTMTDTKDMDISAGQKMLSAVSGSLLTSLLGNFHSHYTGRDQLANNALPVTPLDVVRVRLQSQPSPSLPRPSTLPTSFTNLPPNLGVTACCREVFWVNNASPYCMVTAPSAISETSTSAADCAVEETRRKNITSTLDGLRKIARNEGLTSLWRGLSPTLVMAIPANVIYFTGYDSLRSNTRSPVYKYIPDAYAPLVAGSIARVAAASVISPIEMFRTRMQAVTSGGTGVFTETLRGLGKMVKAEGYTSLWRGLTLTMWRDVPFSGIYWWGYEAMRNSLGKLREPAVVNNRPRSRSRDEENHTITFVDSFLAGAVSGGVASIVTTPFDVGKTRQQVFQHSREDSKSAKAPSAGGNKAALRPEERSMPRFLYSIWRDEGMPGLFKGWAARCLKVAPACAIMISSYEVGKKMARRMNEKKAAAG